METELSQSEILDGICEDVVAVTGVPKAKVAVNTTLVSIGTTPEQVAKLIPLLNKRFGIELNTDATVVIDEGQALASVSHMANCVRMAIHRAAQ
ncbi:hypothetical protein KKC44_00330 [Patescibacteria group bacterium]|nr:hypothetical protein [Patescibacteria group bacterium]MBU2259034.1 hypothetical protein [Patescibacteria group bacterium]